MHGKCGNVDRLSKTRRMMPVNGSKLYPRSSVAFPVIPRARCSAMADATAALLKEYGLGAVRLIYIPGGYPQ